MRNSPSTSGRRLGNLVVLALAAMSVAGSPSAMAQATQPAREPQVDYRQPLWMQRAFMVQRLISVDEYLLWSIAEGGKQFNTEMPGFKDALSRREIWEIIAYMRAGFLEPAQAPPK